ncbi:MAG: hypothetical protein H7274_00940 [Rhodoferax sp.]|nr:hypothetical protein [Rhodoferax sp.]
MNSFMHLKSVEWTRRPGPLLMTFALILLMASGAFSFVPGSTSESRASPLPGSIVNSKDLLRENSEPSMQVAPVLDHSVVNRDGRLAEPEPSSPMSPAYHHV